jgi:uncharacterized membrane protein YagU involved in acid resistance
MEHVKNKNLAGWIIFTGIITGTLDAILALLINFKVPAAIIFKFIASGLFGAAAFSMGTSAVLYGILIHYCIAFVWAIIFFLLYPKLIALIKYRIVLIIATGLVIWLIMNMAVLPLTSVHSQPLKLKGVLENIAALIIAFGLPVTMIAGNSYDGEVQ